MQTEKIQCVDYYASPLPLKNNRLMINQFAFRGGHFMRDNIGAFDAPFFPVSPAEAEGMDPQQRGLLEIYYRALENDDSGYLSLSRFLIDSVLEDC